MGLLILIDLIILIVLDLLLFYAFEYVYRINKVILINLLTFCIGNFFYYKY